MGLILPQFCGTVVLKLDLLCDQQIEKSLHQMCKPAGSREPRLLEETIALHLIPDFLHSQFG